MPVNNPYLNVPKKENKLGSDCSGSDGDTNRTVSLAITAENLHANSVCISINGAFAHYTGDWTLSGNTITFLNIVNDTDEIELNYSSFGE